MSLFGGHPRPPGFGRLPRGLAVAAVAAVTVVPLAASAAVAAPAAPTAYAAFGSAQPLYWASASSVPVGYLHVPFVVGKSNNAPAPVANSKAYLASADDHPETMSGEDIAGLTCNGYDEKACKDPFAPIAQANHSGPKAAHAEQLASFAGREGKFPGLIHAVTDCGGSCGDQFIHTDGKGSAPAGELTGYVSVGSSLANHDMSIDDKGRLVSSATSELKNVSVGTPDSEGKYPLRFSSLVTTAQAVGAGPESTKDGRADLRISDFFILGERVELTRAGLRWTGAGPSEQEAYDGAKVLLKKLRDRGIRLELPNFDAQMTKSPAHVAVETRGLRVFFEQNVGSVQASALASPLELGHATAVVAALDGSDKNIQVKENPNGSVTVETTPSTTAPVVAPRPGQSSPGATASPSSGKGSATTNGSKPSAGDKGTPSTGTPGVSVPTAPTGTETPVAAPPSGDANLPSGVIDPATPTAGNSDDVALGLRDVERNLGLRGAKSVSRAFGAFLGLGLILPLARFVIRRLG
jgi:hypothetical protein